MSHRIFFGSALEDFSLDGSTTYLCTRILPFFSLSYILVTWSCGTKVQLRAQLSGAWEGKGGKPRRCFPRERDLAVERATKRAASADCPTGSQSPAAGGHT